MIPCQNAPVLLLNMILVFPVFGISGTSKAKTNQQQFVLEIIAVTIANQSNKLFVKIESSRGMCATIFSSPCCSFNQVLMTNKL